MFENNIVLRTPETKKNLYVLDVVGTLTRAEPIKEDFDKAFVIYGTNYYQSKGLSKFGAEKKVNQGLKIKAENPKDTSYWKMMDEVGAYAVKKGKLYFDVHFDAAMAIKDLVLQGHSVVIYSAGLKQSLKPMFQSVKMADGKTLDDYISGYFSSSEVGDKTNPQSFQRILVKMKSPKQNSIYVDDESQNAKTAVKAGLKKVYRITRSEEGKMEKGKTKDGYTIISSLREIVNEDSTHKAMIYLVDDVCDNSEGNVSMLEQATENLHASDNEISENQSKAEPASESSTISSSNNSD